MGPCGSYIKCAGSSLASMPENALFDAARLSPAELANDRWLKSNLPAGDTAWMRFQNKENAASTRMAVRRDVDDLVVIENSAFSFDCISRRSFSRFLVNPRAALVILEQASRCVGYILLIFHRAGRVARIY